jgi:hypothetical protein
VGEIGIEALIGLETEVWRALVDGDAESDGRLLSDDFLGVYPTGFSDRSDHVGQLADGPAVADFELSEARVVALSDAAVLLCYRADFRPASASDAPARDAMYVSSLWCLRDGRWVNVFSQDTPAA